MAEKPKGYQVIADRPKPGAEDRTTYVVVLRRDTDGAKAVRIGREPLTKRTRRGRRKQAIRIGTRITTEDKAERERVLRATIASLRRQT